MSELKIKIGNTAYFFCKDIAVLRKQKDTVTLDLSKLDLATAKSIFRGLQAGAIQVVAGEKELKELITNFTVKKELDKLEIKEEEKVAVVQKEEKVEEVKPLKEEIKVDDEIKTEEVVPEVEAEEVKPKPTRQKRSTTKVEE